MVQSERYLRTGEVAVMLGFTPRFVLREVQAGRLRAIELRTGSKAALRYRGEDVRAWLARYSTERNGQAGAANH